MRVSASIVDDQGRVLLIREGYGYYDWDLPGGGVEVGENLDEAIRREVREECGVSIEILGVVGVFVAQIEPGSGTNVVFAARWVDGRLHPGEGEIDQIGWFSANNLPDPILASRRPVIDAALHNARGWFVPIR